MRVKQEIFISEAKKLQDYLVVPNNLLTHTHTHTHTHSHLASNYTFFTFAYARAKRAVTPISKGLTGIPFVRFFVPFCQPRQEGNNNEFNVCIQ